MKFTRRQFIKGSLVTGAYVAAGGVGALWKPGKAHAFSQSPQLRKFIQPLRGVGGSGIPVAVSDGKRYWKGGVVKSTPFANIPNAVATHYSIDIGQFEDQLHPVSPTRQDCGDTGRVRLGNIWEK